MRCHVKVYIIADKYDLNELRTSAKGKISDGLKPTKQLPEFHNVIGDVYNNTRPKDDLRASVSRFASRHGKEEFASSGVKFRDLIFELPEFGRDLAKLLCEASSTTSFVGKSGVFSNKLRSSSSSSSDSDSDSSDSSDSSSDEY